MSNTGYVDATWQVRLNASGAVGDVGKAVDLVGYAIKSGGTAAVPYFLNGSTQANAAFGFGDQARAVSTEQTIALAYRVRFPLGLWVSFDTNTTAITVFYQQMLT
jgi:hypothetical protein